MHCYGKSGFRLFILLILYTGNTFAGGPLVIEGPAGHTPVRYANPVIILNVDPGPLGSRSNAQANKILHQAFALWNNVSTSTIQFVQGADLSQDITINNFTSVLPAPQANPTSSALKSNDGLNPVVYDSDGSIIDAFFGVGASKNTIGFAASIVTVGASHFIEGYAVFNGRDLGLTPLDFKLLIAHELGHFIGLDHTQTNISNNEKLQGSPPACSTAQPQQYAVMYPYICRNTADLHVDDISAISTLYPAANFHQKFGEINGFFTDAAGRAIIGANIWAENTNTGEAVSTISDYLKNNNGFYQLFVPAGNYTLHADAINSEFNGGSGIGPYSTGPTDKSFQPPVSAMTGIGYHADTPGNDAIISVSNGQTIRINFDINGAIINPVQNNRGSGNLLSPLPASANAGSGGSMAPLTLLFIMIALVYSRRKTYCTTSSGREVRAR